MVPVKNKISEKQVKHMAWLARIELSKKEQELLTEQLNRILVYFSKMDEVKTVNIRPAHHVLDLTNVFREDQTESFPSEEILRKVPMKKDRWIKAPRIA
jgi:aspartyl-tRNA(Asn)/glutamyl-tRNA(Gln) amidotransferase subunit C